MTRLFLVAAAAAYCAAQETADESAPLSPISPGQRVAPGGQMSTDGRISRLEAALAALQGEVAVKVPALRQELDGLKSDADTFFVILGAVLVFFMQPGFALLEAGTVRVKNTKNILVKNIVDGCVGALAFWVLGYGFAMGDGGDFIGHDHWLLAGKFDDPDAKVAGVPFNGEATALWFFQYAFAATASTIVSGSVAERIKFTTYMVYTVLITAFVYPCVVHWAWSTSGWASAFRSDGDLLFDVGVLDFAGCGVVHMVGGAASLIACVFTGPRIGRFDDAGKPLTLPRQSAPMQLLGTFILWFGWYGFNCFSILGITGGRASIAARIAANTTLSAAAAAVVSIVVGLLIDKVLSIELAMNGVLAGLVAITSACATVHPWAAVITGVVGALVFSFSSRALVRLHVDDVVDACAVHLACGAWGLIAAGLFTAQELYSFVYLGGGTAEHYGLMYGGGAKILAANVVFLFAVLAWVLVTMAPLFLVLRTLTGIRVPPQIELRGMDVSKHGGMTYPEFDLTPSPAGWTNPVQVAPAPPGQGYVN